MLLHLLAKCVVMTILQDWKHGSAISRRQVLTIICPRHIEAQGTAMHLDSPKIQMIGTTAGLRLGDFKMDFFFHRGASCSTLSLLYGMIRNKFVRTHLWRTRPTTPLYNARHWKEGRGLKIADQISDHLRLRPGTLGTLDNPPRLAAKNSPRFENTCCTEGESHESVWLVRKVGLTQTAKNEKWEIMRTRHFSNLPNWNGW